jgi:TatD DNase family protein
MILLLKDKYYFCTIMLINAHTHFETPSDFCIVNTMPNQEHVFANYSCGIHPWYVQNIFADFEKLEKIVLQKACLAIGECGLDKQYKKTWALQLEAFALQIKLANQIQKPIIIHCVRASSEIIKIITEQNNNVPVIIHGFVQNKNVLATYLQANFYISIGSAIMQNNSNAFKAIANIPIEKLLLETDEETKYSINEIYEAVAKIKNISLDDLQNHMKRNFSTIFTRK